MRRPVRTLALVILFCAVPASAAPPASAAYRWMDGPTANSTIVDCATYTSHAGAFLSTGFYADPVALPKPGSVFYTHLVVSAVGGTCYQQSTNPELTLPAGSRTAVSSANPVRCYWINYNTNPASSQVDTQDCPQALHHGTVGGQYSLGPANGGAWTLGAGRGWEIQVPIVSTRKLIGTRSPCDCLYAFAKIKDFNTNPTLVAHQGVFTGDAPGAAGPSGPSTPIALARRRSYRLGHGGFRVRVRCGGSATCRGRLTATTVRRVSISRRRKLRMASRRFKIGAGKSKRVLLKLGRRGRRLVKRRRRVKVRLTASVHGRRVAGTTVTLKR